LKAGVPERGVDAAAVAERLIESYLPGKPDLLQGMAVDGTGRKVILEILFSPQRSLRPQDVVEQALGLSSSVYFMTREAIRFKV